MELKRMYCVFQALLQHIFLFGTVQLNGVQKRYKGRLGEIVKFIIQVALQIV
jgi:hypothetical protein